MDDCRKQEDFSIFTLAIVPIHMILTTLTISISLVIVIIGAPIIPTFCDHHTRLSRFMVALLIMELLYPNQGGLMDADTN